MKNVAVLPEEDAYQKLFWSGQDLKMNPPTTEPHHYLCRCQETFLKRFPLVSGGILICLTMCNGFFSQGQKQINFQQQQGSLRIYKWVPFSSSSPELRNFQGG